MARIVASNITCPIGLTTEETYQAVLAGKTGLSSYSCKEGETGCKDLPFAVEASLFSTGSDGLADHKRWDTIVDVTYTKFERLVYHSVEDAITRTQIDKSHAILIISSTKGEVDSLDEADEPDEVDSIEVPALGDVAREISTVLSIENDPIVVCNACISGVSALILGQRLVDAGYYTHAIVCGVDVQSRFIISGFQSFKALSPEPCRPFDIERLGLNLGEAAATVVLEREDGNSGIRELGNAWHIVNGAVRNDAYHISAPHPKGDGAYLALKQVTEGIDGSDLAVLGVHGTATMYNDQMESKAIERAGLLNVPLSALKGYFGHTMGAAGVLETILTARALEDGIILPSKGFAMRGVSGKVTLSGEAIKTEGTSFVKMLSGFGGCNGAVMVTRGGQELGNSEIRELWKSGTSIKITTDEVILNGEKIETENHGKELLTEIYKTRIGNYPKFYKMDMLSRLAFVASELLLKDDSSEHYDDRAIVLFNHSSSIIADRQYEKSICRKDEFFPSPAAFVYTLPNITTGEIAIRHGYHGETSFYILSEKDERLMQQVVQSTFAFDSKTTSVLTGWIDCPGENEFECEFGVEYKE